MYIAAFLMGTLMPIGGYVIAARNPPLTLLPAVAYMIIITFHPLFFVMMLKPLCYAWFIGVLIAALTWCFTGQFERGQQAPFQHCKYEER